MNKRDILSNLSSVCLKLNINRSKVTIVGGGASLILGLKNDTADIDVHVTESVDGDLAYSDAVREEDYQARNYMPQCNHYTFGKVSFIYSEALPEYPTFNHRQYNVLTKLGLLMYRLDLGREKDLTDVKLLKDEWGNLSPNYTKKLKTFLSENGIKLCNLKVAM